MSITSWRDRAHTPGSVEDVVVTDELKQELRVMLDALDAINRP